MRRVVIPFKIWATALVDPTEAARACLREPRPGALLFGILAAAVLLGGATLPRQLALLAQALAPTGDSLRDLQHAAMRDGLVRIVVADRVVPPPTLLLGAAVVAVAAEPLLMLSRESRRAVWGVLLLGLAPMVVQRIGELAVTYLAGVGASPPPGEAIALPQRFMTGPLLVWHPPEGAARWLVSLNQRINLVSLWSVVIWSAGLRVLDQRRLAVWHVGLPLFGLGLAALCSWWLSPIVATMLLGQP